MRRKRGLATIDSLVLGFYGCFLFSRLGYFDDWCFECISTFITYPGRAYGVYTMTRLLKGAKVEMMTLLQAERLKIEPMRLQNIS